MDTLEGSVNNNNNDNDEHGAAAAATPAVASKFYAARKRGSTTGGAVFTSLVEVSEYIAGKTEEEMEYAEFDDAVQAMNYTLLPATTTATTTTRATRSVAAATTTVAALPKARTPGSTTMTTTATKSVFQALDEESSNNDDDDDSGQKNQKKKASSSASTIKKQGKKRGPRGPYKKKGKAATESASSSSTTQHQGLPGGFVMPPHPEVGTLLHVNGTYVPILSPAASATVAALHVPGSTTTTAVGGGRIPIAPRYVKQPGKRGRPSVSWDERFQTFLAFQEEFGDAFISIKRVRSHTKYAKLEQWNAEEKERIRDYRENPATMDPDDAAKAEQLLAAGFRTSAVRPAQKWEANFRKMQAYQALHGDVQMTRQRPGYDEKLLSWCRTQRLALRKYDTPPLHQKSSGGGLNDAQAQRLKALGFTGTPASVKLPATMQHLFEAKLKELEAKETAAAAATATTTATASNTKSGNGKDVPAPTTKNISSDQGEEDERRQASDTAAATSNEEGKEEDGNGEGGDTGSSKKKERYKNLDLKVWGKSRIAVWECNFQLMEEYQGKHGTCKLEKDKEEYSPHLSKWCSLQRMQMKRYVTERDKCNLDDEKYARLVRIGMDTAYPARIEAVKEGDWDTMLEKLKAYKEEHGNVLVPNQPRSQLRNWIVFNREQYQNMKDGEKSKMTAAKLHLLQEVGLDMTCRERKGFDERATEWLEYKTKHGKEPPTGLTPLGRWIRKTRRKFRDKENGLENNLTQEQIDKLTSWNFKWSAGFKVPEYIAPKKSWEERFQELLAYKEEHGHVKVPQLFPVLGNWVHRQRKEVSHLKRGLPTRITPEQIEKLKGVGFVFMTRKSPLDNERKRKELEFGPATPQSKKRSKTQHDQNDDDGEANDDNEEGVDGGGNGDVIFL